MGKSELSNRDIWQVDAGVKATKAEQNLYEVFRAAFKGTDYILHEKPKHLKDIYSRVELEASVIQEIFNPDNLDTSKWGVSPDFAIENTKNKKILFGEIKRQDGWVEGKDPSAGRGNAHERLCKLFTPGLIKKYREVGKIDNEEILPFFVVFQGDITRDPKRVREVTFWFDKYKNNFFMWMPNKSGDDLIKHFNNNLKKYLD